MSRIDLLGAAFFCTLLPGCPVSDAYFVDPHAGGAGSVVHAGAGPGAGNGGTAGLPPISGGPGAGGTGNFAANGDGAVGGNTGGTVTGGSGSAAAAGSGALGGGAASAGSGSGGTTGDAGAGEEAGAGGETATCVPEAERCDGIDDDCDGKIDEGDVCPDGCTARYHDQHSYLLCFAPSSKAELDADDASSSCADMGDELGLTLELGLAWIESSDENDFLKKWIIDSAPATGAVWIAANDKASENRWVWGRRAGAEQFFTGSDSGGGTPYMDRFNDWGPGRPGNPNGDDEDCGVFDSEADWQWNDRICSNPQAGFMCEEHPPAQSTAR